MSLLPDHILRFRDIVEEKTGLYFPDSRIGLLFKIFNQSYKNSSSPSPEAYFHLLTDPRRGKEILNQLIISLTTGESYFFRDKQIFHALREYILPEIIKKKSSEKILKIWSAGCSGGEEVYSLLIILKEIISDFNRWDILFLGTDINSRALKKAEKGIYRKWSLRDLTLAEIKKYFVPETENEFRLKDEFRKGVNFKYHNLSDFDETKSLLLNDFDLILCCNVLIYFRKETIKNIIENFFGSLKDAGYLIVGHAEHFNLTLDYFKLRVFPDCHLYQKAGKEPNTKIFSDPEMLDLKSLKIKARQSFYDDSETFLPSEELIGIRRKEEKGKENDESVLFENGYKLFLENKYDPALNCFKDILEINPRNERVCYLIAYISANRGDLTDALTWCEKAIGENSLFTEAYFLMALLNIAQGRREEAISLLKKVIFIEPKSYLAYIQLADLYKKSGKEILARKMYKNAKMYLEEQGLSVGAVKEKNQGLSIVANEWEADYLLNFVREQLNKK